MLAPEDSLRLNVLLSQDLHALRIDEGKMLVHGLTARGEARIQLNPSGPDEKYLRHVRELISNRVLGTPHGYPRYLQRWTRMGQARSDNLERLLKLGESEAVAAVVHAAGITDELARRAWWSLQSSDHARAMLAREQIACGQMGRVLAEFLVEFLPFEEEAEKVVESVRLVLKPGLIDEQARAQLWSRGQRKPAYRVGFLRTLPDDLPEAGAPHPRLPALEPLLAEPAARGNPYARMLGRVLDRHGQAYLDTVDGVLRRCADQGVVVQLFEAIEAYFAPVRPYPDRHRDLGRILETCAYPEACVSDPQRRAQLRALIEMLPEQDRPLIESLLVLSCVGEPLLAPIFGLSDSVGSALRQSIEPITVPLLRHLGRLRGRSG